MTKTRLRGHTTLQPHQIEVSLVESFGCRATAGSRADSARAAAGRISASGKVIARSNANHAPESSATALGVREH
jgi:hypothetical protein